MPSCAYFVPKCLTCEDFVESALINGGGDLGAGERHDVQCVGKQGRMVLSLAENLMTTVSRVQPAPGL